MAQGSLGDGNGLRLAPAEAQREGHLVAMGRGHVRGGDDMAVRRRSVRREGVRGVELGEAVAGGARVADARRLRGRARQGHVSRHRVVPVDGVGDRVRAGDHRDRRAGGSIHHAGVGAGVGASASAVAVDVGVEPGVQVQPGQADARAGRVLQPGVHQHRVARRVGDVGGDQPETVLGVGGGDGAGHARGVGGHRVGHVTGLQVGERSPVGHDVLQRAHVRVVDRGLVDIGEHPAGHRVPDFGSLGRRRAQAVLPGQVEIRWRAWRAGGGRGRPGRRGRGSRRDGDSQAGHDGRTRNQRGKTASAYHG